MVRRARRTTRRTARRTTRRTTKRRTARKGKAFGGYTINFRGRRETAEQIFGRAALAPSEMTKRLWRYVKGKRLSNR